MFDLVEHPNHLSIVKLKGGEIVETFDFGERREALEVLESLSRGSSVRVLYLDSATERESEIDLVVFEGENPLKKAKSFLYSKGIYAVNLRSA